MTDIPLKDALLALKAKINEVSSAPATTAEDLAMLGTAIEKIAGRVSVVEFELIAQDLTQQLQTIAAQKLAEVSGASGSAVDQIENLVEATNTNFVNLVNAKEAEFNDNAAAKTTTFNNTVTMTGIQAINTVRDSVPSLIFSPLLNAGSITKNTFGFITRWDQGNGIVYSNITYDSSWRIIGWDETLTKPDNTKLSYHYTATYSMTGEITSVTRYLTVI